MKAGSLVRRALAVAAASVACLSSVVAGPATSMAAPSVTFDVIYPTANVTMIEVAINGSDAGEGYWSRDPSDWAPLGDTLYAYDGAADGYGIEAHLSTGRVATTRGHTVGYTDVASGDLPEDQYYYMWVCAVKDTFSACSAHYTVLS